MGEQWEGNGVEAYHEVKWRLSNNKVWLVIMDEFGMGDRIGS